MSRRPRQDVLEQARRRSVLADVDVAVAGAGLSGVFAAIAAGRCGARVLLIDRMPAPGGNIGPGMILGGTLDGEADITLPGGLTGIAREFMTRLSALRAPAAGGSRMSRLTHPALGDGKVSRYPEDAGIASYVLGQMLQEARVEVLLSAYVSDPLLERKTVKGLFVETKAGRVAVRAKVVVDGTGEADVARRSGAPMAECLDLKPGEGVDPRYKTDAVPKGMVRDPYMQRKWPRHYNDTMMLCLVANVDNLAFARSMKKRPVLSKADQKVADRHFNHYPPAYWPGLVKAWRAGTLPLWKSPSPDMTVSVALSTLIHYGNGLAAFSMSCRGAIDPADPAQVSLLERELRHRAFEGVQFLRAHVGGFERAWLVATPSYLGTRGGPRIVGDHTLTIEEMFAETRFDDVLYRNIHEHDHDGPVSGYDVPLRCALPKGIEGLLVCGRGAAYERRGHDPTGMRARPSMMVFGQCIGTAAALAARTGVPPRRVGIRKVQRRLVKDGIVLGDPSRLKQLGLT